jgi:hypothetical protein
VEKQTEEYMYGHDRLGFTREAAFDLVGIIKEANWRIKQHVLEQLWSSLPSVIWAARSRPGTTQDSPNPDRAFIV